MQVSDYLNYKSGESKLFYRATWIVRPGDRGLQKQRQKPPVLSVQTPKGTFYMKYALIPYDCISINFEKDR
jgi:hypothetical protein